MWELADALEVEVDLELELAVEVEMQLEPEPEPEPATAVSLVALPLTYSLVDPGAFALEIVQLHVGCWGGSSDGQWLQGVPSELHDPFWPLLEGLERCFH